MPDTSLSMLSEQPLNDEGAMDEEDIALPASGSLFKAEHRAEVVSILTKMRDGGEEAHSTGAIQYDRVNDILEEYQEQGVLLRSALPELAKLIVDSFWKRAQQDKEAVLRPLGDVPVEELLVCTAPPEDEDAPRSHLHEVAAVAYTLAKVVGPKNLLPHLPHDVRQFEYAFYYLLYSIRCHPARTWEVRYFLMLWMTNTVLVPFDLSSIDSGLHSSLSLKHLLVAVAQHCLQDPGKMREVGSLFVSRLLTRPDMARSQLLPDFLRWCERCLAPSEDDTSVFSQVGALAAVACILKVGKRDELAGHLDFISDMLTQEHLSDLPSMLIGKNLVKSVQRLGLAYLKPKVVSWRYQRGMRSLLDNLQAGKHQPEKESKEEQEQVGGEEAFAPAELEPILDILLASLKNQDTIVRWSSAKGIGRITARLDKPEADDVVAAVLDTFELYEDSNGWHGACLALAELARRGLLLPQLFPRVIPIALKALQYEIDKGTHTVGRPVRDAGCYVFWAFARAYAPSDVASYAETISAALLATACFDKEISVRRAAAAAFQECIGRLGNFPHGIDIVTRADYFTLSNRRRAYLQIAPTIAAYDRRYHEYFAEYLVENRLLHCDKEVRQLAADALGLLSGAEERDSGAVVLQHVPLLLKRAVSSGAVEARHGAVLGLAAVVRTAAGKLAPDCVGDILTLMPRIESARLYRGRGGEHIRIAVCKLIEAIAVAGIDLPEKIEVATVKGKGFAKTLGRYQQSLDENLSQIVEGVQDAAASALQEFASRYYTEYSDGFHGKATRKLLALLPEEKLPNERRGAALGLGVLPHFDETHQEVLTGLLACVPVESNPEARDAETRRNACISVARVACRKHHTDVTEEVFTVLENATRDYTIDQRGDVGSLVRVAAMEGLSTLVLSMKDWKVLNSKHVERLLGALLRQATEKLDKVRKVAGTLLATLVSTHGAASLLSSPEAASAVATAFEPPGPGDWGAPQETYQRLAPLLAVPSLRRALLDGIVVSAGGMSVHVSRPSFEALRGYMSEQSNPEENAAICKDIAQLLQESSRDERVAKPLLGTVDKLLSLGLVPEVAAEDLAQALREEVKKASKDIHILLPAVDVLCGLLPALHNASAERELLFHALLILIAGKFPKVRSKTGTCLYTTLLVHPHLCPSPDEVSALLSSEQWDAPSAVVVRTARDRLYPLLGLVKPAHLAKPAVDAPKPQKPLPDANAMYAALVKDAGY